MAKSSTKKPDLPALPSLEERLPEAIARLQAMALRLPTIDSKPILLLEWQRTYGVFHGLKGLTKLLPATPALAAAIVNCSDFFGRVAHGDLMPSETPVSALEELAADLKSGAAKVSTILNDLESASVSAPNHAARLKLIPSILSQPPDLVSKIAWAATLEKWNTLTAEAEVLLELFPDWSRRAHDTVENTVGESGCIVHVAPQLQMGDGRLVHAIIWAAVDAGKLTALRTAIAADFPEASVQLR